MLHLKKTKSTRNRGNSMINFIFCNINIKFVINICVIENKSINIHAGINVTTYDNNVETT